MEMSKLLPSMKKMSRVTLESQSIYSHFSHCGIINDVFSNFAEFRGLLPEYSFGILFWINLKNEQHSLISYVKSPSLSQARRNFKSNNTLSIEETTLAKRSAK